MTTISRRAVVAAIVSLGAVLATDAAAQTTHTVTIRDFAFVPERLTIAAGDAVRFVNEDGAPHTATARNGAFDTGRLARGEQSGFRFSSAGRLDYFCEIHPRMTGTIVIE